VEDFRLPLTPRSPDERAQSPEATGAKVLEQQDSQDVDQACRQAALLQHMRRVMLSSSLERCGPRDGSLSLGPAIGDLGAVNSATATCSRNDMGGRRGQSICHGWCGSNGLEDWLAARPPLSNGLKEWLVTRTPLWRLDIGASRCAWDFPPAKSEKRERLLLHISAIGVPLDDWACLDRWHFIIASNECIEPLSDLPPDAYTDTGQQADACDFPIRRRIWRPSALTPSEVVTTSGPQRKFGQQRRVFRARARDSSPHCTGRRGAAAMPACGQSDGNPSSRVWRPQPTSLF